MTKKTLKILISDVFLESGGLSGIIKMTKFSHEELSSLLGERSEFIKNEWSPGRVKRNHYTMFDILLMPSVVSKVAEP